MGLGFRDGEMGVWGSGFRVWGSGFRVCGWGFRDFRLKSLDFLDIQSFGLEIGTEGRKGVGPH